MERLPLSCKPACSTAPLQRITLPVPFRDRLGSEIVVGVAGADVALATDLDSWLGQAQARGLTQRLWARWTLPRASGRGGLSLRNQTQADGLKRPLHPVLTVLPA